MSPQPPFTGRHTQLQQLLSLITPYNYTCPMLQLYGPHNTGKTSVLQYVLQHNAVESLYVDCRLLQNERHLLQTLTKQLHTNKQQPTSSDDTTSQQSSATTTTHLHKRSRAAYNYTQTSTDEKINFRDKLLEFTRQYQLLYPVRRTESGQIQPQAPLYAVFDHANLLATTLNLPTFLPALNQLSQLHPSKPLVIITVNTHYNINSSMSLESSVDSHIGQSMLGQTMIGIEFGQYSAIELTHILSQRLQPEYLHLIATTTTDTKPDVESFDLFISQIIHTLYHRTTDLLQCQYIIQILLPQYVTLTAAAGNDTPLELQSVMYHLQTPLSEVLRYLYHNDQILNVVTYHAQLQRYKALQAAKTPARGNRAPTLLSPQLHTQLSTAAKYLLMAAYLASYNPTTHDRVLVNLKSKAAKTKGGGARKKATTNKNSRIKLAQTSLGPKAFSLDRMMAIFTSLSGNNNQLHLHMNAYTQIATLTSLNLLLRGSHRAKHDLLDEVKLVCAVTYDDILAIGESVKLPIREYMYDAQDV